MKKRQLFSLILMFGFLLGVHEGYIALWRSGQEEPLQVFPYRAEMLPRTDREALIRGIEIKDGTELAGILEDYLS